MVNNEKGVLAAYLPNDVELTNNSTFIIGQIIPLVVTLTTNNPQDNPPTIKFESTKNVTFLNLNGVPITSVPLFGSGTLSSLTVYLSVTNSDNTPINDKDEITFTITTDIPIINTIDVKSTARTINLDSLALTIENKNAFLEAPLGENIPPSGTAVAPVTTTLMGESGPLPNAYIFITDVQSDARLKHVNLYNNIAPTIKMTTQLFGHIRGAWINSDSTGKIQLNIYPQKPLSMVLELGAMVTGIALKPIAANSPLFIANIQPANYFDAIHWPNILGYFNGPLISDGDPHFYVAVEDYANASPSDYILFFTKKDNQDTKKIFTGHYYNVVNPDKDLGLDNYSIKLPYDIFDLNIQTEFSYMAIYQSGAGSKTSAPSILTFQGGVIYRPPTNVKRNYDPCIIYTSTYKDKIHGRYIIPNGTTIGIDNIKAYPNNHEKPNTGLFIEVLGKNNSATNVPLGTEVTLTMYIETEYNSLKLPFKQLMPTTLDADGSGYAKAVFHIEEKTLSGFYPNAVTGVVPTIWFEYTFSTGENTLYSKLWEGNIDTRPE
ncbi:hypothetical protein FE392_02240 [Xenorhabdus sp. 12]|uniref:Uncharacterized protein n=1 Tax=Xenorhabdus santafensis TaxID=2582833 RepID=A0ABU4S4L3_9GAMM|nr:hypothetical protein [Xenorhabdus sp. 12]MDX7986158.1 hypothetical protein [Xenorhabdus sp. 12]